MVWQFKFDAPVKTRYHKYFTGATIWDEKEPSLWWSYKHNKFVPVEEIITNGSFSTSSKLIRTFKAFKRFLRKHPELRGRTVVLLSKYANQNITATYIEE